MWFHRLFQRLGGLAWTVGPLGHNAALCAAQDMPLARAATTPLAPKVLHLHEAHGTQPLALAAGEQLLLGVQQGTLWLTQHGHTDDHVLLAGQQVLWTGPAQLMLGALGDTRCVLSIQAKARHAGAP